MTKRYLVSALLLGVIQVHGQVIFPKPLSPRIANYQMQVRLDAEKKQAVGSEILTWRNTTDNPTKELQFHLYMNAFKNTQSTHISENGGRASILEKKKAWGWIDVHSLSVDGVDLTGSIAFIHPDDDNAQDQTVLRVVLDKPVRPGQSIQVKVDFTTQLPWVYRRNGYYKDFVFFSQWFPKIGVLEAAGWNCHQFHANSEFFADYGVYDVSLTLPEAYVLGSTGTQQSVQAHDGLKTYQIRAEDVHDFAWTAWPGYLKAETIHRGVKIIHLYEKDHAGSVELTLEAMKNTLDYMTDWVGAYPYPNVTVVHGPTGCQAVNGMEYPMFVTGGAYYGLPPKAVPATAMVTVHEFGHNWFYGMIGNNEFEEAWLDEGLNSYAESRIMDHFYGVDQSMVDLLGLRFGELAYQRMSYLPQRRWNRILRPAWTYVGGGYGAHSYSKPTLMLTTLENLLGRPTMDQVMKTFFTRWRFRHPHSQDFIDVVNEVTGQNYDFFFDQLLKGSNELDYRIGSVYTGEVRKPKGLFDENGEKTLYPLPEVKKEKTDKDSTESVKKPTVYKTVVKVHRQGEVVLPVDVLLVFENGDSLRYDWDGQERWAKYVVQKESKLDYAVVDPDRKLVIDSNLANNSMTVKPRKAPVSLVTNRLLYWFETALSVFGFLG